MSDALLNPMDPVQALAHVTTASISSALARLGVKNAWLRGPRPISPGQPRCIGPAFTMRFLPLREDLLTAPLATTLKNTRQAIEAAPAGAVIVVDALGCTEAGAFGDVLTARMHQRGIAGLVVDGAIRDLAGVWQVGLPVWSRGTAAPLPTAALTFWGWQEPIACGGVAVFPGDWVVADEDGVMLIPQALLAQVIAQARATEQLDAWVLGEVARGVPLPGLYPPNDENLARYKAHCADQGRR